MSTPFVFSARAERPWKGPGHGSGDGLQAEYHGNVRGAAVGLTCPHQTTGTRQQGAEGAAA